MATLLNPGEREILVAIARHAIETFVRTGHVVAAEREEPALNQHRGCFVTIHRQGELPFGHRGKALHAGYEITLKT